MTPPSNIRAHFADWLSLLADPSAQEKYEADVPFVPAHVELVEAFYDLYTPEHPSFEAAFTVEEARRLADLESALDAASRKCQALKVHSVAELQELPEWRHVVTQAQRVRDLLHPSG